MNYLQSGNRIRLMKPIGKLANVGEIYEIGVIAESAYIIRDVRTKIAVIAIDFDSFDEFFVKESAEIRKWTKWHGLSDAEGNVFALYRTNGKKVQVKLFDDDLKAESSCNTMDEFDLRLGISLAMLRCHIKKGKMLKDKGDSIIKDAQASMNSMIKAIGKTAK